MQRVLCRYFTALFHLRRWIEVVEAVRRSGALKKRVLGPPLLFLIPFFDRLAHLPYIAGWLLNPSLFWKHLTHRFFWMPAILRTFDLNCTVELWSP